MRSSEAGGYEHGVERPLAGDPLAKQQFASKVPGSAAALATVNGQAAAAFLTRSAAVASSQPQQQDELAGASEVICVPGKALLPAPADTDASFLCCERKRLTPCSGATICEA